MEALNVKRLKELEEENARLKKMFAELNILKWDYESLIEPLVPLLQLLKR